MSSDLLPALRLDPLTGALHVAGVERALTPGTAQTQAREWLAGFVGGHTDFGNGYAWLKLEGVSFGGLPAALGLCFHHERLSEATWGVWLPNAEVVDGWPTRPAIDAEIAFVSGVLAEMIGRPLRRGEATFRWGKLWCCFDPKGFQASSGLRYRA